MVAHSPFIPPFWLRHGHAQTIYGSLWAPAPAVPWKREIWPCPDDDFIHVDRWGETPDRPTFVIFHGLEGNTQSSYVKAMAHHAKQRGWNVVAPNFRGCSGTINRAPRLYHAGDSAEIHWILEQLRDSSSLPLFAAGISLGGNMLLKWLGEQGKAATKLLTAAAAIAPPLELAKVGRHLDTGFNRIYSRHFLASLKLKAREKFRQYPGLFDLASVLRATTLREFDDHFMAPLHGFSGVDDYWTRASSKPWVQSITVPTLLLNAKDDPFIPTDAHLLPQECPPALHLDQQPHGGHVGFVSAPFPGRLQWMPERILQHLSSHA